MRRTLALLVAVAAVLVTAPSAAAVNVVKCVNDNNRIGFPYGGWIIDPEGTVDCIV